MQEGASDALKARALLPEPAGDGGQVMREPAVIASTTAFHEESTRAAGRRYPPPWPRFPWKLHLQEPPESISSTV